MHSALTLLTSSLLIAGFSSPLPAAAASPDLPERLRQQFEPILDQAVKDHDIPGFAMAVVADGRIVYTVTRGVRSLAGTEPMTERSLFHMASVTKPFVATSVMQLVEAGKVDLDQPVQ